MAGKTKVSINLGGSGMFLLGLVLVIGKLAGWGVLATAPWWLVTMPFWIGLAIFVAFLVILIVVGLGAVLGLTSFIGIAEWWQSRQYRNRTRSRF